MLITSLHYQLDIWVEPQTRKLVCLNEFWEFFLPTGSRQLPGWELIHLDLNQGGLDHNLAQKISHPGCGRFFPVCIEYPLRGRAELPDSNHDGVLTRAILS